MDPAMFARGLVIGLSIAAPVGPIGVLCIRRTLADGRWVGLATGFGAATADGIYGGVAGFGLTVVSSLLLSHQTWIRLIGGLFLCWLGAKTFIAAPAESDGPTGEYTLPRAYASAVALTLTNPSTILSFVAIFAGVGLGSERHTAGAALLLVLGVLLGSALWWVLLTHLVSIARAAITGHRLRWVNRVSGAILVGFGLLAFASLIKR
ncbi:MAG TPA: LysE family translocator [Chloroflexota bacterium]|nr:LysE family translocator [Chloroflexota bacterium]